MRRLSLLLLFFAPSLLGETKIDITAHGVSMPVFDAVTGAMTRKLTADSASGPVEEPRFVNAVVLMFSKKGPADEPMARLFCDDATYDHAKNLVVGAGKVHLIAPKGSADGLGYDYDLKGNRLVIKSRFRLETEDYVVEADSANMLLANGPTTDDLVIHLVIRQFEALGHVTIFPKATAKAGFDQAMTDRAWYSSDDRILHTASPVRTRTHGENAIMSSGPLDLHIHH